VALLQGETWILLTFCPATEAIKTGTRDDKRADRIVFLWKVVMKILGGNLVVDVNVRKLKIPANIHKPSEINALWVSRLKLADKQQVRHITAATDGPRIR
jgi:hypothetical protein